MKILKTIFFTLLLLLMLAVGIAYVFINSNKQEIVQSALNKVFKRDVQLERIKYVPPATLEVDHFVIPGLFEAKRVQLQLGFPLISKKEIILSKVELIEPLFIIKRAEEVQEDVRQEGKANDLSVEKEEIAEKVSAPPKFKYKVLGGVEGVRIDYLEVIDGRLQFLDVQGGKSIEGSLEKINLKAQSVSYPLSSVNTEVVLSADILSEDIPFTGSTVEMEGWINYPGRNMDGVVKILEPSGETSLTAHLKSKSNDMEVNGKVKIGKLTSHREEEDSFESSIEDFIFGALDASGLELDMDFSFKTKMDDFQLGAVSIAGNVGFKGDEKGESQGIESDLEAIGKQFEAFGKKFYEEKIEKSSEKEKLAE